MWRKGCRARRRSTCTFPCPKCRSRSTLSTALSLLLSHLRRRVCAFACACVCVCVHGGIRAVCIHTHRVCICTRCVCACMCTDMRAHALDFWEMTFTALFAFVVGFGRVSSMLRSSRRTWMRSTAKGKQPFVRAYSCVLPCVYVCLCVFVCVCEGVVCVHHRLLCADNLSVQWRAVASAQHSDAVAQVCQPPLPV